MESDSPSPSESDTTSISTPSSNRNGKGKSKQPTHDSTYTPPDGSILFDHNVDFGDFDWDAVKDDEDAELWLIRVPDTIKAKHLEKLKICYPPSSSRSVRVGQFERKHTKYDVWSLGEDEGEGGQQQQDDNIAVQVEEYVGGEELKGLTCLLPSKRKDGKLYMAPKPISRHLVLSTSQALPTADPSDTNPVAQLQNPPRHSYPKEALKHRFTPYGSTTCINMNEILHEVDVGSEAHKSRKRSRESDPPRKHKKAKVPKPSKP